jgi:GxxExxY protein
VHGKNYQRMEMVGVIHPEVRCSVDRRVCGVGYHACLCRELELREIAYRSKHPLPLDYKGIQIAKGYVIDLLIEGAIIVEVKAVDKLLPVHSAQLMTYMRLLNVPSGLLMNFNVPILPHGIRRLLL